VAIALFIIQLKLPCSLFSLFLLANYESAKKTERNKISQRKSGVN